MFELENRRPASLARIIKKQCCSPAPCRPTAPHRDARRGARRRGVRRGSAEQDDRARRADADAGPRDRPSALRRERRAPGGAQRLQNPAGPFAVDTAHDCGDQRAIAGAIAASGVDRAGVFIGSKVPGSMSSLGRDADQHADCLAEPTTSYVDLTPVRSPW